MRETCDAGFLTHWGRATHICVSKLTIIALDNGLSPGRRQAIIWNNAGILSIRLLGTNFSEILIEIHKFLFKKMRLKVSSAKLRPCCLGLNVLINTRQVFPTRTVGAKVVQFTEFGTCARISYSHNREWPYTQHYCIFQLYTSDMFQNHITWTVVTKYLFTITE